MQHAFRFSHIATRFMLALCALIVLGIGIQARASAAPQAGLTFTVNTTQDTVDKTIGDGKCADKRGKCSLRAAIMETNKLGGKNTVTLPAGTYTLSIAGENEDDTKKGDLDIRSNLSLKGAGAAKTVIDGAKLDRVFHILKGTVSLSKLTIRNGQANTFVQDIPDSGYGGAISVALGAALKLKLAILTQNTARAAGAIVNQGTVALSQSTVDSNTSGPNSDAGTVVNVGTMTIDRSTIINNVVHSHSGVAGGGGIFNAVTHSMTIKGSTIANNQSDTEGGGIENLGTLALINTTVSGNSAIQGGGIYSYSAINLYNVTVANNHASGGDNSGGGIYAFTGSTTNWKNSIFAGNTNANSIDNCYGTLTSNDYNLMTSTLGCNLQGTDTHDQVGLAENQANLGPLQNNGGSTMTHALLTGSLAIDAGNPTGCTDETDTTLATDQRDSTRPTDGDGANGARCDVGAFEK